MGDIRGFLKWRERELPPNRPIAERVNDYNEVHDESVPVDEDMMHRMGGRCMNCGVPFCHMGCPVGNLIPEWNDMVHHGEWEQAIERLHRTNNFPDFTGRVCPAPCETACVLGINQPPVTIKNHEYTIVEKAWSQGWVKPQIPERLTGFTVAVVGSGPAGMAAAQQLTRAGHTVAVYERADKPGGLVSYGIPNFKLDKSVVDRRVAQMEAEGTRFRCGVEIGKDLSWDDLRQRYDAVIIATGSTTPRDLPLPGRELDGIHYAVPFLTQATKRVWGQDIPESDSVTATGKHVVVIGGGDTGSDCVGTSLRQHAASVTSLEITPMPPEDRTDRFPWPTYPMIFRVSTSHEEGGEREYAVTSLEFLGDGDGRVRAIKMADAARGADGRFSAVPGTERELPADLVLIAMGFTGPESAAAQEQVGLDITGRGNYARDNGFASSVPGIFVAGDAGRGQSLVVWAISEGRACAAAVDQFLQGKTELTGVVTPVSVQAGAGANAAGSAVTHRIPA